MRRFSAARRATIAIAATAVLAFATAAYAQEPAAGATGGVAAHVPDRHGMEMRLAACAYCHGAQGQGDLDRRGGVYPRLAGQPAGYLYEQMTQFVSGARVGIPPVLTMRRLLESLTPAYLRRIAEYYHNAAPAYPPELPFSTAELHAGREIVEHGVPSKHVPACTVCHGERLDGRAPATPFLAGQNDRYLTVQFMHWILGQRRNPLHRRIALALSEQQRQAVAAYLSSLRPQHGNTLK